VNRAKLCLGSIACTTILAAAFLACGGSSGTDIPDGGGPDATANPSGDAASADTAPSHDATQDGSVDADAGAPGDSGSDTHADSGAVISDSGSPSTDASDAATAFACDGSALRPPDASVPPVHLCNFPDGGTEFPLFAKCCASTDDCALGVYQNSCCGDTFALGLNKSQVAAFQQAVANWSCAPCGCAGSGLHTEDGKLGVSDAGVKCDNGWCMSYAR
jgi:hypothetical protein